MLFCFGVTARLEISESKVRVAEGIVGGKLGELRKRRFSLRQLVSLEITESEHAGGVELLHRRRLVSTSRGCGNQRGTREDDQCPPDKRIHSHLIKRPLCTRTKKNPTARTTRRDVKGARYPGPGVT